jgi:feruloyl-CoA synthase
MSRPIRQVRLGRVDVAADRRPDGTVFLRSREKLAPYPEKITEKLDYWAERAPDRLLFAQRDGQGSWRRVTYAEARQRARRIAGSFLEKGLSAERPIVVLSGNDIEHALIELAALYAGIPYAPISPAYSLLASDFSKLKDIFRLLTPGFVFASQRTSYEKAAKAVVPPDAEIVFREDFESLEKQEENEEVLKAVDEAHARVGPDTIAKFLFTSGSTGAPKAVINTQRMWCSNQEMARATLAFVHDEPPVMVAWAPWHHTAGGNKDFGMTLFNGGSLYIDEGKPLPGSIEETVRNLREIATTFYFNVPKGYEALLPFLRSDADLRKTFFSRLKVLWFAGAGVAQHVFDEYKDLSYRTCGEEILFLTGFGSTETAPFTMGRTWDSEDAANMGLPPPGVEVKLVPFQDKYEMRLKGPHIFPGYWRQPELTAQAFDEEGYYRLGDAFEFADANFPEKGLIYKGRIAEDFKLSSGTWVHVGPLRARFIEHFAPLVRDVVIAGEGRSELAALVFPWFDVSDAESRKEFDSRMSELLKKSTGSSNRIARFLVLEEPPSIDAGEVTDKGSINQRAILSRRRTLVDKLYEP